MAPDVRCLKEAVKLNHSLTLTLLVLKLEYSSQINTMIVYGLARCTTRTAMELKILDKQDLVFYEGEFWLMPYPCSEIIVNASIGFLNKFSISANQSYNAIRAKDKLHNPEVLCVFRMLPKATFLMGALTFCCSFLIPFFLKVNYGP